jgi:hypothetical protein
MSNFPLEENNTFDDVTPSQIDDFDDVAREIKKIRLDEEKESTLVVAENVPSENVSNKVQMKRNTAKCRRGRKITNPLKCRECGKIFTDTSNRRKHENNRVCSASKARDNLTMCIGSHSESIYAHLVEVYADIAKHMKKALGRTIFERNKNYLLEESLQLMKRSWINEQYNILLSLEAIEKIESMKLNVNMNIDNL